MDKLKTIEKSFKKKKLDTVSAREWRNSVVLEGIVKNRKDKIRAGYIAADAGYKGVVNDIGVEGVEADNLVPPPVKDGSLDGLSFDAVVIGGGVIGCAIARELCRYDITVALLEKEEDIAMHASSRNDGMVHPGLAPRPKSKKALYNIRGNRAYDKVSKELGFDFKRVGSLILFSSPFSKAITPFLYDRAKQNGVDGYEYINKERVAEMEPHITPEQHGAFYLHSTGIVSPYKVVIAYAENAISNGAKVFLETAVLGFDMDGKSRINGVKTNRGTIKANVVINCAGVWADKIAGFADDRFFSIHPRKGVDCVLDTKTGKYLNSIIAMPEILQLKSKTKGGGLIPTIEGNLIAGPTAVEIPLREDYSTSPGDLDGLIKHLALIPSIGISDIINYFAGTRACTYEEDFVIEASEYVGNLVHIAGIQSPGLASAPSIAQDGAKIALDILASSKKVKPRADFEPVRKPVPAFKELDFEERSRIISKNPSFGRIVCRCEGVFEGEVEESVNSEIPARSTDAVKRRTRAGMGRCHGGFCSPRIIEILSRSLDVPLTSITKRGGASQFLVSETKTETDYSFAKSKFKGGNK